MIPFLKRLFQGLEPIEEPTALGCEELDSETDAAGQRLLDQEANDAEWVKYVSMKVLIEELQRRSETSIVAAKIGPEAYSTLKGNKLAIIGLGEIVSDHINDVCVLDINENPRWVDTVCQPEPTV